MNSQKTKTPYAIVLILLRALSVLVASIDLTDAAVTQWETFSMYPLATVVANNWECLHCKIKKPDGKTDMKKRKKGF